MLDVKFGDEFFLREVRDAILKGMEIGLRPNPGDSALSAFNAVTYSEENEFLSQMGGKIKSSELFEVDDRFFNVHQMETEEGGYSQVYINVTQPIKRTYIMQALQE